MSEGFCTVCNAVIESFNGLKCCPSCNTKSVPCSNKDQVTVSINIHELRILCMWSEQWVMKMRDEQEQASSAKTIRAIVHRLSKQIPKNSCLLLSDEIEELKKDHDIDTNFVTI